jgi:hypothetical protein
VAGRINTNVNGLPALLCVDVEPDDREVAGDIDADWSATEPCLELVERFRDTARSNGVTAHVNWFVRLDPQIADAYGSIDHALDRFRDQLRQLRESGDGIGVHTHAWRNVDGSWIADHGNRAWVRHCVTGALEAFTRHTGQPPSMFRFGDRFLSNDVIRLISDAGVRYDMTIEPGFPSVRSMRGGEAATGSLPSYRRVPRHPYRPSRLDYRRPAHRLRPRPLQIIPISTGGDRPDILSRGKVHHLNLALDPARSQRISDRVIAHPESTHLAWVARTGDFAVAQYQTNFEANLDYLSRLGLHFLRPDEIWP